jgi:hypothetical protein
MPLNQLISKIPILNIPDEPMVSTTQDLLPIADVVNDIIILKDGSCAIVLESTSLNFGLLSEREQEAVIYSYAGLINSLSFSIQILVRSLRKDISNYLTYLDEERAKITNPKLASLMDNYRQFITETVKKKNVLGKRFFIIIPFSAYELGTAQTFKVFTQRSSTLPFTKDYIIKKAKITLYPRRDHLVRQGNRLGLKLTQLNNEQIMELLYDVFNPKAEAPRPEEVPV